MNKKIVIYSLMGLLASGGALAVGMTRNVEPQQQNSMQFAQANSNPHAEHSMSNMSTPEMNGNSQDNGHHEGNEIESKKGENLQAKLSVSNTITPNQPATLVIYVKDSNGKVVTEFDTFQEKLMHLIVVSDDLQVFNHLHPTYKQNGRFEVEVTFPQAGNYTIFSDYKPSGQQEEVSILKTKVPGNSRERVPDPNQSAPKITLNTTKIVADTKVNLTFSQPTLKVGQEVMLTFELKQAGNEQAITDLQPYLGEKGHLVILKQSSPLTEADYIHAHAIKDPSGEKVQFMTSFPQPGKYKLWGQFNRNGKIVVADFWVNVVSN